MATASSRLDDPNYKNWLKDTLALMYMKEALEDFADARSKLFHADMLKSCRTGTSRCSSGCTFTDLKRDGRNQRWYMSCALCNQWLTAVISHHTNAPFPKLSPENTNPQKWYTDYWETSKLFMSYGCRADTCAKDSDIQGILSLFINSQFFTTSGHIGRADLLDKLVEVRNVLFHLGSFQVSDTVLNDHLDKIIDFLQGMTGLTGSQSQGIQATVLKIYELQSNRLDLSLNKELELKALQQRQIGLEREMRGLETTVESLKKEQDNHETKLNSTDIKITHHEHSIRELKALVGKFDEFLEANNLKDDITRMSKQIKNMERKMKEHDQRFDRLESDTRSQMRYVRPNDWMNQCKDLQQLLIDHYKTTCLIVQNPAESNDIGLEYLCVDPNIRVLRQSKGRDGLKNVKEEVTSFSCRNIFFNEEYQSRQIYITGEAGSGKSMLCKNLVRLWCEAHGMSLPTESGSSESNSEDEISGMLSLNIREHRRQEKKQGQEERKRRRIENREILSHFSLLFYITLKDSQSEYSISDMIQSQILKYHESVKGLSVSVLLKSESCLVIADGLDEWVCPAGAPIPHFLNAGIPGRDIFNKSNVFLTTSRPWKFHILELKSSELDKHIEVCELNEKSAVQICSKVVKLLNKSQCCRKTQSDFFSTVEEKGLGHFKTIPVILIQLICLWYDNQDLGKSQVQLYCAMLDLLLRKSPTSLSAQSTNAQTSVATEMPACIMEHQHCQNHQHLIYCLSRVAFEALFAKTKENSLVFRSSQLDIYGVGKESIDICLQSGILSQSKLLDKCSVNEKKISFLHKKFQEFLAAIFIASCDDVQNIAKRISDFCSTLDTCLEMSQLWLFMSGIRPDIARQLLNHFTSVIAADRKVEHYRQTLDGEGFIRDIQICVVDCIIEGFSNGHSYDSIVLEDFYVNNNTASQVEQLLSCTPMPMVKSVYINTDEIGDIELTSMTCQLQHSHSVQKLHLYDFFSRIDISTLEKIVNNNLETLTCLELTSDITATAELVTDICSISSDRLIALKLEGVRLAHKHIEKILTRLSQSHTVKHLQLSLHCADDFLQCRARIDLTSMTHIQTLDLENMSVDNLQSVSHCVENVTLVHVILPVTTLCEFARRLSQTKRDCDGKTLQCNNYRDQRATCRRKCFPQNLSGSSGNTTPV